ncbi:uncharacterized protein EI90DRAFT_3143489 [Cantharellus anzutake]|uniref:uncharacterized protein n=1 Tax=Cantharellus anzutake TaxID=1750568 RepID=UPI0019074639|nr:uncharacterized protein EI90DRAFT_3143489 [Cantharellus anzutake]KAF8342920.1 hypothetical protein EI90DRAFT_3143489 [Cantharellus anzutake]
MSPYGTGTSKWSEGTLNPTSYQSSKGNITVHHLNITNCPASLVEYLHGVFETELEMGNTYPQEGPIGVAGFTSYFFQADVFIGIAYLPNSTNGVIPTDLEQARSGREWKDCVAGAYYVKPNYPGRSSHICNAGFISFLHYAPLLGYRGSVFNLVYKNNLASLAIWDRLGFQRAGLIPGAGRLKKPDGSGEEYVDAIIFYKSFVQASAPLNFE